MVDDILSVAKCSHSSVSSNVTVKTYMEIIKLEFSSDTYRKKEYNMPKLKSAELYHERVRLWKYLGDYILEKGFSKQSLKRGWKNLMNKIGKNINY